MYGGNALLAHVVGSGKIFEKADELKNKVLRFAELNKLLDMGEVEEKRNDSPLAEDVKRAIIDF